MIESPRTNLCPAELKGLKLQVLKIPAFILALYEDSFGNYNRWKDKENLGNDLHHRFWIARAKTLFSHAFFGCVISDPMDTKSSMPTPAKVFEFIAKIFAGSTPELNLMISF
ncbi:unnamed protein product [Cylicocyclus nassatus]|uniref:Uncharacterized protein n=1 Tax=Cylicocyclus nassatus TaxID=53992 RepID=A0AA36H7C2_CYLNA|nr:unnamed protein product [Cylicocyclus nassatus]